MYRIRDLVFLILNYINDKLLFPSKIIGILRNITVNINQKYIKIELEKNMKKI